MENIIEFLKGKKTFILVIIGGIILGAHAIGIITADQMNSILTALGLGVIATIRDAIRNIGK